MWSCVWERECCGVVWCCVGEGVCGVVGEGVCGVVWEREREREGEYGVWERERERG